MPVDPATGKTVPVEVVPGEPEGTYRLKSDPRVVVYVPVEEQADGTMIIPPQEPTGEVATVDGQQVTKLYGTQLGSNYVQDPVLGMVRFLPDNVAWLRWILGPWVGILAGDDPLHRHQRRPHRRLAPGLLAGPASPAAARARAGPSRRGSRRTSRSSSSASSR